MNRYIPQIRLDEIGEQGQSRLSGSRILIVGCGALGSPMAMYLAGAGVGHITIADFDNVETSNLHRQVFYTEKEVGLGKAELLGKRMRELNSEISIQVADHLVTKKWLESRQEKFDLIADAADNPATTYMLDAFCAENGIPLSTAGVSEWKAQIFFYLPGSTRYSDVFERPSEGSGILPCSIAGITGPLASFAASIQSIDIIKHLAGVEASRSSRLISADLLNNRIEVFDC